MMKISILTLFPKMFKGPFDESIIKRAIDKKVVEIEFLNIRDWATDSHKSVDDHPYGGGKGMVLKVDVIDKALKDIKSTKSKVILMSPQGKVFNQKRALQLSKEGHIILIAGHYEGFDERIREYLIDEEISIGDYVLTGGEIPAMVITDSIIRLIPGVLEKEATENESFTLGNDSQAFLEHPQYTHPEVYNNWSVPKVLLSGNHKEIEKWKNEMSEKRTKERRPDLLNKNKIF